MGRLGTDVDVDYFRIELPAFQLGAKEAGGLVIKTVGGTNMYGELSEPTGEVVLSVGHPGYNDFSMTLSMNAGTYYLRV